MPELSGFLTRIEKSLSVEDVGIAEAGTVTSSSWERVDTLEVVQVRLGISRSPKPNCSP